MVTASKFTDTFLTEELRKVRGYSCAGNQLEDPVARAQLQADIIEELLFWRAKGRQWLECIRNPNSTEIHSDDTTLTDLPQQSPKILAQEYVEHVPLNYRTIPKSGGKISEVTCSCGEVTRYKVPLNREDEFECPKRGVHAREIQ